MSLAFNSSSTFARQFENSTSLTAFLCRGIRIVNSQLKEEEV